MRVALVADPYIPVPPTTYGGIERVIAMLVAGLVARGHGVSLWAAAGSRVPCELETYGTPPHRGTVARVDELTDVAGALWRRRDDFDIVHSFGRLAALAPILCARVPKIQTYQREITTRNVRAAAALAGGSLLFTSCGTAQRKEASRFGRWVTVPNGVPASLYTAVERVPVDAPLVFLGRVERIKGPHTAIAVARASGRRLVIAGNVPAEHRPFFEHEVMPFVDGERVRFVGPVGDREKDELLGAAAALLMPVEWEEPFGIVMVEALACGTPVIGLGRGAVPEVISDGETGFVCADANAMARAVARLGEIDRRACRRRFELRFSDSAVVSAYEGLYREMVEGANAVA